MYHYNNSMVLDRIKLPDLQNVPSLIHFLSFVVMLELGRELRFGTVSMIEDFNTISAKIHMGMCPVRPVSLV